MQMYRSGGVYPTGHEPRSAIIEGDIAKIPLGVNAKDGYAIVDKEFAWLDKYKWRTNVDGYAVSRITTDSGRKDIRLHRLIVQTELLVDHKNLDKLDNRRCNLREATYSQNLMNTLPAKRNKSGYKGVNWHKRNKKYRAVICVDKVRMHLGSFDNVIDAAKAYNTAAKKYFGEFARLNDGV